MLQQLTGIHRAKLGRIRVRKYHVTFDEAETIFAAVRRPGRALFMLACLEEDREITPEAMEFLDGLISAMPRLIDQLIDFGPALNPKWAQGTAHHIGALMAQQVERKLQADKLVSPFLMTARDAA